MFNRKGEHKKFYGKSFSMVYKQKKSKFMLVSNMPPCRLQQGGAFGDIGPTLRLKRMYQSGGGQRRKIVYAQPDFYIPNRVQKGAGVGALFMPLFR